MYIVFPKMFAVENYFVFMNLNFYCCELILGIKAIPKERNILTSATGNLAECGSSLGVTNRTTIFCLVAYIYSLGER